MAYRESDVRRSLASHLAAVEPGLVLIDEEVKVPNAVGAKGFIDILARDRFQNLVVIEVKKEDQTARQALHEVVKYAEPLRREHGRPAHRIRLVIASTAWHELTVPFSAMTRMCPYSLMGLTLTVDSAGSVTGISPVDPLPPVSPGQVRGDQLSLLWTSAGPRNDAWTALEPHLAEYGLRDALGIELDYEGDSQKVIYPFALALIPGRIAIDDGRALGYIADDEIAPGIGPEEIAEGLTVANAESLEGLAINDLMTAHPLGDTAEALSFESFLRARQVGWSVKRVHRKGVFAAAHYIPDNELIQSVMGVEGENRVVFTGHATPSNPAAWEELLLRLNVFLAANEPWRAGLAAWLEIEEQRLPANDCHVAIYHHFDIIRGLLGLSMHGQDRWLDALHARTERAGTPARQLIGSIIWDGSGVDPLTALERVVDGGVDGYVFTAGSRYEDEPLLLAAMGLHHVLLTREDDKGRPWFEGGGQPLENPRSLDDFIETYQAPLAELQRAIEQRSIGFLPEPG